MSHVVLATYEEGVLKLDQHLPLKEREKVRVTIESLTVGRHSILDIARVNVGKILHRPEVDDDLLGEMLEGRR